MRLSQQVTLDDRLLEYLLENSYPLPPGIIDFASRAEELGFPTMQIAPDQAVLMRLLLRLVDARRVLEIGTFIGFSSSIMADAIGAEGTVVCLDRSEEWTGRARELWQALGLEERIDLRLGDAHVLLAEMDPGETFDAVFIDADKAGYVDYLDQVTPRLRPGGLLMVDNTLWSGRVTDHTDNSADTLGLREFNRLLSAHPDYETAMVAVGDGLTVALRR